MIPASILAVTKHPYKQIIQKPETSSSIDHLNNRNTSKDIFIKNLLYKMVKLRTIQIQKIWCTGPVVEWYSLSLRQFNFGQNFSQVFKWVKHLLKTRPKIEFSTRLKHFINVRLQKIFICFYIKWSTHF
jgi:hypothetical protein